MKLDALATEGYAMSRLRTISMLSYTTSKAMHKLAINEIMAESILVAIETKFHGRNAEIIKNWPTCQSKCLIKRC